MTLGSPFELEVRFLRRKKVFSMVLFGRALSSCLNFTFQALLATIEHSLQGEELTHLPPGRSGPATGRPRRRALAGLRLSSSAPTFTRPEQRNRPNTRREAARAAFQGLEPGP